MSPTLRDRSKIRKVTAAATPEPPPGLFSNCFVVGDTVYVSGQHAGTPKGVVGDTFLEQAREALKRVLALVKEAGGDAADVVKLTIFLTDMAGRPEVSVARREVFKEPFPCSTMVGVTGLAGAGLLVEIEAIAVLGAGARRA